MFLERYALAPRYSCRLVMMMMMMLCDPIWQVTPRKSEMETQSYSSFFIQT